MNTIWSLKKSSNILAWSPEKEMSWKCKSVASRSLPQMTEVEPRPLPAMTLVNILPQTRFTVCLPLDTPAQSDEPP